MSRTIHRKPFIASQDAPQDIWRYQGCTRKRSFETERVAVAFVVENPDLMLEAYHCPYCSKFHLSSEPKRVIERLERHLKARGAL